MTTSNLYPELVQIVHEFFYDLDEMRYDALLGLMREDARWHRQGKTLQGHPQILAALEERSRTQRIRHLVTNAFVETSDDSQAVMLAYLIAYRFDDGTLRKPPLPISGPFRLLLVRTRFSRDGEQWRIAEQRLDPQFEFTGSATTPAR